MADAKRKRIQITTPKVVLSYPKLTSPDFGNEKYPKPNGEFSAPFIMKSDDPATKAFIAKLQPLYDAAMANAEVEFKKLKVETRKKLGKVSPNELFTTLYDQETEEPTGEIRFKVAMTHSGENKKTGKKWTRYPAIFDAKGKPIPHDKLPDIWGGTVAKVAFSVEEGGYFIPGTGAAGLKLTLEAIQIIELSSGSQKSASGYGFGAEEGGFSADEEGDSRFAEGEEDDAAVSEADADEDF